MLVIYCIVGFGMYLLCLKHSEGSDRAVLEHPIALPMVVSLWPLIIGLVIYRAIEEKPWKNNWEDK